MDKTVNEINNNKKTEKTKAGKKRRDGLLFGRKRYRECVHSMDYALIISSLFLSLIGIVMAFSASYYYSISEFGNPTKLLYQNLIYYLIGWVLLLLITRIDYHLLRRFSLAIIAAGLGLLLLLLVFRGTPLTKTINNATRWLNFGISIMPGELIKGAIIIFFSAWFSSSENVLKDLKSVMIAFLILGSAFVMILRQPNLSTAIIVAGIGLVMMLVAGLSLWWLLAILVLCVGGFLYLYFVNTGYMHDRIVAAFNPWADSLGEGYQVIQSLLAFGSGGVKGVGLGKSIQKTLYLPEPQSDFILPIIGEELGFVGIVVILILYAILIGRLISIALRAKDSFGCFLAVGTAALLSIHIILNILVVTATFPPTGVFLPFMSQGGNATWVILCLIGIVGNVSRQAIEVPKEE